MSGTGEASGEGSAPAGSAPKVFGIGLSRTGTTSLAAALGILGYRAVHFPDPARLIAGDLGMLDEFDAATDTPVAALFPLLDQRYPGSRFVLTVREEEAWLDSVEALFRRRGAVAPESALAEVRRLVYGRTDFDREHFRHVSRRHARWVRRYFAHRPGVLLEMDISAGDGWERLCPFLGVDAPPAAFPRRNTSPRLDPGGEGYFTRTITGPGIPFGRAGGSL